MRQARGFILGLALVGGIGLGAPLSNAAAQTNDCPASGFGSSTCVIVSINTELDAGGGDGIGIGVGGKGIGGDGGNATAHGARGGNGGFASVRGVGNATAINTNGLWP